MRNILRMASEKKSKRSSKKLETYKITEKGSLGLLALGDIGLRAWRKVKNEAQLKRGNEKKT